jgi:hypothetical protein
LVLSPLDFSFSPAEVPPPAALDPPEDSLEDSPPVSLLLDPPEDSEEDPSPVAPVAPVELVEVVEVEVVWTAAFSAEVSVGGVMSGVLLGVTSETLLPPPQARRVRLARRIADAARPARPIEGLRTRGAGRRSLPVMRSASPRALSRLSPGP